jgi:hypothetical protein
LVQVWFAEALVTLEQVLVFPAHAALEDVAHPSVYPPAQADGEQADIASLVQVLLPGVDTPIAQVLVTVAHGVDDVEYHQFEYPELQLAGTHDATVVALEQE